MTFADGWSHLDAGDCCLPQGQHFGGTVELASCVGLVPVAL